MATAKPDITTQIIAANAHLAQQIAAGDAAGAAACYTKTALLMPPNHKACKSARAIAAYWQAGIDMGIKSLRLKTTEVDVQGRTVVETGVATIKGARNKTLDVAKYVVVWKREGKNWKLHWDIFNSNNAG
jgi:ketosteroid isomerase-like protein